MKSIDQQSSQKILPDQSQDLLDSIINSTSDLIWSVDPKDFGLTMFNRALRDFFLGERGLVITTGMRPEDLHPAGSSHIEVWKEYYRKAKNTSFATEHKVASGSRVLQLNFNPIMHAGSLIGISVFGKDVTEKIHAKHDLRVSEELFRNSFENTDIGVSMVSGDGRFLKVNQALCNILGYSPQELVERHFNDLTHEEDKAISLSLIKRAYAGEINNYQFEKRYITKGGRIIWVHISTTAIRDEKGRFLHSLVYTQDITRQKQAQEEVRLSGARYRNLVENQTSLIARIDLAGNLTFVNHSFCVTLGKNYQDMIGTPFADTVFPDDLPVALQTLQEIRTPPHHKHSEMRIITKNGMRVFRWENSAIQDEAGEIVEYQGVGYDITDQKNAENAIRESGKNFRSLAKQLQVVNQIGLNITAGLGFNELMDTLYTQSKQIVEMDTFFVALYDEEKSILNFPIYYNDGVRRFLPPRNIMEQPGLAGHIIQTRQSFYCPDMDDFQLGITLYQQPGTRTLSIVDVPLIINDRVIGVMSMQSYMRHAYTPEQVSILESLATQAAIAIQNSQLFENVQREKTLTDALFENIPEFFFLMDRNGKLVRWNKQSEMLWDSSQDENRVPDPEKFMVVEDQMRFADIMNKVFTEGQIRQEVQLRLKDGRKIPIFMIATRLQLGGENYLLGVGIDIMDRKKYEEDIKNSYQQLHKTFIAAIDLLALASEQRDPYTAGHQQRVAQMAVAIAQEMGLDDHTIEGIRIAGIIHDIGKMSLPSELLSKPSKLTKEEYALLQTHAENGYSILKKFTFPWPLAEMVYQHHERVDGAGYPQHLNGDDMLLEAKILSVADVVEAMSSHRPYRPGLGIDTTMEEIKKYRGIRYDETVVDVFLKLIEEGRFSF